MSLDVGARSSSCWTRPHSRTKRSVRRRSQRTPRHSPSLRHRRPRPMHRPRSEKYMGRFDWSRRDALLIFRPCDLTSTHRTIGPKTQTGPHPNRPTSATPPSPAHTPMHRSTASSPQPLLSAAAHCCSPDPTSDQDQSQLPPATPAT